MMKNAILLCSWLVFVPLVLIGNKNHFWGLDYFGVLFFSSHFLILIYPIFISLTLSRFVLKGIHRKRTSYVLFGIVFIAFYILIIILGESSEKILARILFVK